MKKIINQLAEELTTDSELITNVTIDTENHTVDFTHGSRFWAKLSKDNSKVIKNSVRIATY